MKSGYMNKPVVRGSALSFVISLYERKNGYNDSSFDESSFQTDSKSSLSDKYLRKEFEHVEEKSDEDKSFRYKLDSRNIFDWPDLDEIDSPEVYCEDRVNSKNINSDGELENTSLNDSCKVEVEVEINKNTTSFNSSPSDKDRDRSVKPGQLKPPETDATLDEKMFQHESNISDKNSNQIKLQNMHSSKNENNSLTSDGGLSVKPILLNPSPLLTHHRKKSGGSISEQKSVTFSEDTVFNDNKPKRYKKERINLKDIYRGKIDSNTAIATVNPVYVDDEEDGKVDSNKANLFRTDRHGNQLTDDEKVARFSFETVDAAAPVGLNMPCYMQKYLQENQEIEVPYPYSSANTVPPPQEKREQSGKVTPPFGRLIERTLRKERQKRFIRWIIVIMAAVVVFAVVTGIGVYFGVR